MISYTKFHPIHSKKQRAAHFAEHHNVKIFAAPFHDCATPVLDSFAGEGSNQIMNKKYSEFFILSWTMLITLFIGTTVNATLGKTVDSIENDRGAFFAITKSANFRSNYVVHNIQSGGASIREYVSSSNNIVFAIAWNGVAHPDLNQLLGSYSDEYQQALKQTVRIRGRRQHLLKTPRLVVEKWGHMRNLQGRAFDPSLIPAGVSSDEIK